MKNFIQFSVEKIVTVFMVVIAIIIFGVVSFNRLTTDLIPDINLPFAVVVTTYPGATPEEVEQEVTVPLENSLQTTTNILEVTSTSAENFSMIMLEFSSGTSMDSAVIEMREGLNMVLDGLPDSASNPNIIRLNPDMLPVMSFSVTHDDMDLPELTEWLNDTLSPRVERVPGVASLNISGGYESEVRIQIDQALLDEKNDDIAEQIEELKDMIEAFSGERPDFSAPRIDKEMMSGILQAQNFAFPAGFINYSGANYMVRVGDELADLAEIRNLKVFEFDSPMPGIDIPTVRIEDVATVELVNAEDRQYSKVNGNEAVSVSIQKGSEYATTDVADGVNAALLELAEEEEGLNVTVLFDQGEYINLATGSVINNLIIGGILAIVVLFVFLRNVRMTFVIGVAIPISLTFAIVLIYLSGITLNIVSLGGLALGIGMLVDNSIVVIENIYRMRSEGKTRKEAAIRGTHQVAGAIIASTLTTIGVFLPIMFIEDFIREIFYQLALTITFSLLASLLIALTFVPTVANRILKEEQENNDNKTSLFDSVKTGYEKVLSVLFKVKALALIVVALLFGVSILAATSRGFEFFPATDEGTLQATMEYVADTPMDYDDFEQLLDQLGEALRTFDDIETVGITYGGGNMMGFMFGGGDDQVTLNIVLREDRDLTTVEMADQIQAFLEANYEDFEISVQGTEMDTAAVIGAGIQFRIRGNDLQTLSAEAERLAEALGEIDGLRDIDAGLDRQTEEIKITVDKDVAIQYGLTVGGILMQVSEYLEGPEMVTTLRMNQQNYDVYIYDDGQERQRTIENIDELKTLVVGQNPFDEDEVIALEDVAEIDDTHTGFPSINHFNGVRSITVSADFERGYNATLVGEEVDAMLEDYDVAEGYELTVLGENEEIVAAIETLILVGALGIALVYMIMASQFQSLTYPFIIMMTIPLAFTGGFGILYIFGLPVSIVALIGLIILSGVVVNNGIVLVDYINQLRERGYELMDAIVIAGRTRLRPIFMTALTTILALSAMAIGIGQGDEMMQPMAITAIGGLIYATFLTIFIIPIMYDLLTRYGRYVFGFVFVVVGLVVAILYGLEGNYWLMGIGLLTIFASVLAVFLVPQTQKEQVQMNVGRDDHES